jgi:hypothetical protein
LDHKGIDLPNIDLARNYAITFGRELMQAKSELRGERWSNWAIEIQNARFERIALIPLTSIDDKPSNE